MSIFGEIAKLATGGIGGQVLDIIERQFPGKLTPQEQSELSVTLERMEMEREQQANNAIAEAERSLNERVAEYEGTASEIKDMWLVGPLVILMRSLFRPICSYVTLYLNFVYFTSVNDWSPETTNLLVVIDVIVFGFWFGERAVKNVLPIVLAWMDKRQTSDQP